MKRLSNRNDATVQTGTASEAFINVQRRGLSAEMIMSNQNNGGPAFPELGNVGHNSDWQSESGMTLRDYFAAKALGLCFAQYLNHAEVEGFQDGWRDGVASDAYQMADAMLRAREAS